jgi:hypothetical protein
MYAHGRKCRDMGVIQPSSRREHALSRARFSTGRGNVLTGLQNTVRLYESSIAQAMLHHDDAVSAVRRRRSGHDFDALTRGNGHEGRFARTHLTDQPQAARQVCRSKSEAIAHGPSKRRI